VIEADALLEWSRSSTGLDDFGGSAALAAFVRLVDDLNTSARLSTAGEESTRRELVRILTSRLEVVEQLKRRPDVRQRPVTAPIVIAGLPRTGTTFLHHLMACDRQFDVIRFWQGRRPYVPDGDDDPEVVRRRQEARQVLAALAARSPAFLDVHPMAEDEPDECIVPMQLSFVSPQFEVLYRVPGYSAWVSPAARETAYRELGTLLQLLQRPEGGGRWLLKSPGHTDAGWPLVIVFPDVRVVQVHRDPVTVMASFCSLTHSARRLFSDDVDRAELGREWLGRWATAAERFWHVRESMAPERVCDIRYSDLVGDPVGAVRSIYERFGLDLTPGTETAMRRWLVEDSRARSSPHRYALADYHLTQKDVVDGFEPYLDRFSSYLR
jgi:hypothetical protein